MSGGTDIRALLQEHDACGNGIEDAIAVFGPVLPPGVTLAWAVAVAAGEPWLCRRVGWAVGRLVEPGDVGAVAGADLSGAKLRGAYLRGADLSRSNLRGADLRGASLQSADLRGAHLMGSDLRAAMRDPEDRPISGWALVDGRLRRTP